MPKTLNSRPRADGFRMPAEYEPHAGCFMVWPERPDNWRLGAKPAQEAFAAVAEAIGRFEPVTVGASAAQFANARARLSDAVRVIELSTDDAWARDTGPTFVVNGAGDVRGVDWGFNAWGGLSGGLYFPWDRDAAVARKILEAERRDRYEAPLILEGGSIHVDGQGTCIVTEECLLNENRNPRLSRKEIEALLRDYLAVDTIVWIPRGVYLDETDGHVDNLLCFSGPGEILLTWTDDRDDPQYERSLEALRILESSRDAKGNPFLVRKLVQPGPLFSTAEEARGVDYSASSAPRPAGGRLAGSYVNHYVANGAVIVPTFGVEQDGPALTVLAEAYPGREIVGVPGREILLGGGNIHCITQQYPAGQGGR